jgi:hypothetical protein
MQHLYKGFKKVAEDQQKAFLKHDNGHELHIAKSGLSKKHIKALEKLPLYQAEGTQEIPEQSVNPEEYKDLAQWSEEQKNVEEPKTAQPQEVAQEATKPEDTVAPEAAMTPSEKALTPKMVPEETKKPLTYQEELSSPSVPASQKLMAANKRFQDVQRKQQEADQGISN